MNHYRPLAWMMAIAIAGTVMTACSLDGYEPEKPFTTDPVEKAALFAIGIGEPGTRSSTGVEKILFTDNDIEWFDLNTRELRFRDVKKPLRDAIPLLAKIDFYLGGEQLFSGGATCVGLICSQMFDDLVLCCGKIDGEIIDDGRYYLYDCYPLQFIDTDEVKANRLRRAPQWETFLKYLESKGKLRK
ncbi:MAG: hypothetical protein IJT28_03215 [Bacteroidaceae bacterium]|nr:hypothetical protein [Prevotella sp.]MBQ7686229.1 hypothetical protein [Bacteroidaceae bacterium]